MRFLALLLLSYVILALPARGQQVSIELGKSPVPINQYYTISIKLQNQPLKDYTPFPDIEGFKKSSKFSSTKTIITGGTTTTILTITQNYAALEEGTYELKPFTMKVNGQTVQSAGMQLKVLPMTANSPQGINLPNLIAPQAPDPVAEAQPEFIEKEDNAFLTLYTSKKEVFVGEGVTASLYFYLAEEDQRLLDFYDFANQMSDIIQQLKQPNAWEERFDFAEITPENVTIKGVPYLRFKLYEAVLYPLNSEPLHFPALTLKMIKYKVAKNPNLVAEDRQEGFKTFYAREKVVPVRELPPHPLRDMVPVGDYSLHERLSGKSVQVGKSVTYQFQIAGEGNLAAIMPPVPTPPPGLDFYPPDVRQDVTRRSGRVLGSKTFSYTVLPREPGSYQMRKALQWIYFNPATARYDTLHPTLALRVTGVQDDDALVLSRDLGTFYNIIENEDDTLVSLHLFDQVKQYANIILMVLLAVSAIVFLKK
ncbi:BatD family protein [Pontibacter sp. 172403-2]|uniref:BatD family protein n=1 Tax=Pontibacter rufus TaxID=2791028 RepID=UPI0018B000C7|nr:BatD family protein [Pontibacter sp. 172403-2]MBF9253298.1 BatD family protein [Pontibacter sp. 172403-2]